MSFTRLTQEKLDSIKKAMSEIRQCNSCGLGEDDGVFLRVCSRCKKTSYCSKICQRKDYKKHKQHCVQSTQSKSTGNADTTPTRNSVMDPKRYLNNIGSEEETYRQLIDAYRIYAEDEHGWHYTDIGLYAGEDPYPSYREFMKKAKKAGILPGWWNKEKETICNEIAKRVITQKLTDADIAKKYNDPGMPRTLRMISQM